MFFENLLELWTSDQIVFADLIDGNMCIQMAFQVVGNTMEDFGVTFTFGGFWSIYFWKFFLKDDRIGIAADQVELAL